MAEIFHFRSSSELDAAENLSLFIQQCRDGLLVFGRDLDWEANYWTLDRPEFHRHSVAALRVALFELYR